MTSPRFHVPGAIEDGMHLPEAVSHHMARVLRMKEGDRVILFNGEGGEYACIIDSITKKTASIKVLESVPDNRESPLDIHLGLCVIKKDAMDRVIQYSAELGVRHITPLISDNCTVARKVIRTRQDHWQQVAVAACEQSGLNLVPRLNPAMELADWLERDSDCRLICVPGAAPLEREAAPPRSISILTGPEGGFTDDEVSLAESTGFTAVSFGQRILRAETAPLVAVSVLHRLWGDY